jgi:hypothetical protein
MHVRTGGLPLGESEMAAGAFLSCVRTLPAPKQEKRICGSLIAFGVGSNETAGRFMGNPAAVIWLSDF